MERTFACLGGRGGEGEEEMGGGVTEGSGENGGKRLWEG